MFLEAWEVPLYSDCIDKLETKFVKNSLDGEEFAFFRDYMDADAFGCFLTKKTEYGSAGHEVREFIPGGVFVNGDYVHFRAAIYQKVATQTPDQNPEEDVAWTRQTRFSDSFLESVWVLHLRSILAFKVHIACLPSSTYQTGSKGATALQDDNTGNRGVTKNEMTFLIESLGQKVYNKVDLMKNYILINKATIPCLEWKTSCGCGGQTNPVRNPVRSARKFYVKGRGFVCK